MVLKRASQDNNPDAVNLRDHILLGVLRKDGVTEGRMALREMLLHFSGPPPRRGAGAERVEVRKMRSGEHILEGLRIAAYPPSGPRVIRIPPGTTDSSTAGGALREALASR